MGRTADLDLVLYGLELGGCTGDSRMTELGYTGWLNRDSRMTWYLVYG